MRQVIRGSFALLVVLVGLAFHSSAGAAGGTTYDMRVNLDFGRGELNVVQKVRYLNRTGASLPSVAFDVAPVHFKAFKLLSAEVNGEEADWRLDGVSLEIILPANLEPGEFTEIELQFDLQVPAIGGRFGKFDSVMALGNWYPLVAVYRDGWYKHDYTPFGDPFFSEIADYEVTVESQSNVEIAHTGSLVKREGNTWSIKAEKVRDFAMAVSDLYETKSVTVDGVKITAFNARGRSAAATLYLDATSEALRWLNKNVGSYPYESLHIAEVNPGKENLVGQEYPNIVFISSGYSHKPEGVKSYAGYLIVHEIAHQWFYAMVGNDQLKEPWIDEALATYLAYRILDWAPLSLGSPAVAPSGQSPVNSTVHDFKDETQYSATTYGKGTVFLQELAAALKGNAIDEALREFFDLYKFKITTSRGFLSLIQSRTATNLNPVIRRFFANPEYKAESPLKVEIEWPEGDAWTGAQSIGFRSDVTIKRIEVDADGVSLLKASSPSSPITLETSGLVDGEYLVEIAAFDENGRVTQAARRMKVSGGVTVRPAAAKVRPTPTPAPAGSTGISVPFNVQLPDYSSGLTTDLPLDAGRILLAISALGGFFVLFIVFMFVQSRRSYKNCFEFSGPKYGKRPGTRGFVLKPESAPEVRSVPRLSSSIVADFASPSPRPDVPPSPPRREAENPATTGPVEPRSLPVSKPKASETAGKPPRSCRLEGPSRVERNQGKG